MKRIDSLKVHPARAWIYTDTWSRPLVAGDGLKRVVTGI
jgi:hypothetical protein